MGLPGARQHRTCALSLATTARKASSCPLRGEVLFYCAGDPRLSISLNQGEGCATTDRINLVTGPNWEIAVLTSGTETSIYLTRDQRR